MADEESNTRTIRDSELEAGVIFLNDDAEFLDRELTREQWDELLTSGDENFLGIAWEDRKQWLEVNGYEITRPNLRDANLPSAQAREEAEATAEPAPEAQPPAEDEA